MSAMPRFNTPPLTPEQELAVREIVRQETREASRIVAAIKRAVLQIAAALKDDPSHGGG